MSLDGIVLHAIVHEWQSIVGGRINKIHQPNAHDIVMQIRTPGETIRLLLSANPTYPRVHITSRNFLNPLEALMFSMILRKYCENGVITSIQQVGFERIIHMDIRHRDEIGDTRSYRLIIEIMGRHSNIILIDPLHEQIIDGIHHVTPALSSYRVVMPSVRYKSPPEQHKLHPLQITEQQFAEAFEPCLEHKALDPLSATREGNLTQWFVNTISGLSPLLANELLFRSHIELSQQWLTKEQLDKLWHTFSELQHQLKQHNYQPEVVDEISSGKSFFSVIPLLHKEGNRQPLSSAQLCLDHYFSDKSERDLAKQRSSDLVHFLQNEWNKNKKKIEKLHQSLQDAQESEQYRTLGELLTAHMHIMEKGMSEVQVTNYYDEAQPLLNIPLDPYLTPSENAQRYFKKYTKSKNSLHQIAKQLEQTQQEIEYVQTLRVQLETTTLTDIEEIRQELIDGHYLRERAAKQRKIKKQIKPKLTSYKSSEGIEIYVGKNNTQNDYLTHRIAQSHETWLHTKSIPGSHVVIRSHTFSQTTLLEAAQLAAFFSQAKHSSSVPVDYTLVKHVHKPNGAKPGFVTYDHQKTVFVTPDESTIKAWESST